MQNKTVVLVLRSGGDFDISDVELLAGKLKKYCEPVRVICFCDRIASHMTFLDFEVRPLENNWRGWWAKMNLFSPALESLRPFLYLDLDTAIIQPFEWPKDQTGFIMLRDFYRSSRSASGAMWIPAGSEKVKRIWEEWIKFPNQWVTKFRGDQEFINSVVEPDYLFQDVIKGIVSFKPGSKWRRYLIGDERIVCFHGKPRIPAAAKEVEWVKEYCK